MSEKPKLVQLPKPEPRRKNPHTFNLRMPDDLELRLKACAVENRRSLNEEIVYRLLQSLTSYRRSY